jgi:hypothetical protein
MSLAFTAVFAGCLLAGNLARAQLTNQLHFAFTDAPGGTTTPSDTSLNPGAISTTLTMRNPALAATDLHGAVGSGVTNNVVASLTRAMDFTSDIIASQTNQPAASSQAVNSAGNANVATDVDPALAGLGNGGIVDNFVITMWFKQPAMMLNGSTIGPRLWILNANSGTGTGGVDSGGSANSLGLKFQQNNQLYFQFGTDGTTVGPALASPFPTNKWLFIAITYDGTNFTMYYGSDTAAAQAVGKAISSPLNRTINLGVNPVLAIGNRYNSATADARGLDGWINDFRFYHGGVATAAFVESVRESALGGPPDISGFYPDGSTLMQGTNTLVFNASSATANIASVDLVLNGIDVTGSLVTSGPANDLSCSYTGLTQNQPVNTAVVTAIDANGLSTTASATFDTFGPTNFIIEAEEFNFNSGVFIDNPSYTDGNTTNEANSYYGLSSVEGVDTHKGGAAGLGGANQYRFDNGLGTVTQTPVATGEQSWPKLFDLVDTNGNPIVGHMIGDWSSGEWQNYTKTFPAGSYNVYARASTSPGATITFAQVTGATTISQTTTNLGTFTFTGTSFALFQWVPLKNSQGNLAVVNLAGQNTVRATTGGGANADFYMFVTANTNLPVITPVYPDGQYLFEPTNTMLFTVSSPISTISTANVTLTLNGSNVSSHLVFSGGPSTWNVTYSPLQTNQSYTAVINVVDAIGNPAAATVNIDTWNPVFQVESEDFDFDPTQSPIFNGTGFRYIDNPVATAVGVPAANSYEGQVGVQGIDEFGASAAGHAVYRPNDPVATTPVTDFPRRQFTNGAVQYNVGFLGAGFWQQYTKTWPAGTYNLYGRLASGFTTVPSVFLRWQQVIAGWGTANQVVQNVPVGTFTIPTSGGYSDYLYIPLIDRFGNYAQVTLGGTNTFRALLPANTVNGANNVGLNINFYMLVAPRTDLPRIDNVYPDGSVLLQKTNTFSFVASSPTYGLSTTGIVVTLNGNNISSQLVFSGASPSFNVSYPGLQLNTAYSAVITVTDFNHQTHSTTVNFDTFDPNSYTWEAEDFDFDPALSPTQPNDGLRYIDNPVLTNGPATNSYFGQQGDVGTDYSAIFEQVLGTYVYRSLDYVSTEVTSDALRQKYLNAQLQSIDPNIVDYDINFLTNGAWIDYTRTFPSGNFLVYARLSAGNGAFNMQCAQVTSGAGSPLQVTNVLGNFIGSGASFTTWQYVPLTNATTGSLVVLSLGGLETLQMTGDNNENANFFLLVPVVPTVTASINGPNITLSFPTVSGLNYTVSWKNNLTDPAWTPLSTVPGNGTVMSVNDSLSGQNQRFYRLAVP